jgi:hypothetical protein
MCNCVNLDGDIAIQLGVSGAPDFAHPTFTDLGGDPVMRDGFLLAHRARF